MHEFLVQRRHLCELAMTDVGLLNPPLGARQEFGRFGIARLDGPQDAKVECDDFTAPVQVGRRVQTDEVCQPQRACHDRQQRVPRQLEQQILHTEVIDEFKTVGEGPQHADLGTAVFGGASGGKARSATAEKIRRFCIIASRHPRCDEARGQEPDDGRRAPGAAGRRPA